MNEPAKVMKPINNATRWDAWTAALAVLSIGGLAALNLIRMLTLTEKNSIGGTGPFTHDIVIGFGCAWFFVGIFWVGVFVIGLSNRDSLTPRIAGVSSAACIPGIVVNFWLYSEYTAWI